METAVNNQQTCSFKIFTNLNNSNTEYVCDHNGPFTALKDCTKSITSHLYGLNVSYDEKYLSEGLLICARVGIFSDVPYLTVCPYHRAALGLKWKRKSTCVYPSHNGKCKGDRPISFRESYALAAKGILIPVGSAVCKFCKKKISSQIESFPDVFPAKEENGKDSQKPRQLEDITQLVQNVVPNNIIEESKLECLEDSVPDEGRSSQCSNESKEMDMIISPISSQATSQISSWSQENEMHVNSLGDINEAINIISNGKISPIKFQVRSNIEDLKPSSLRNLKRKAMKTVHETLECLAPSQAKKLLQIIHVENDTSLPPSPKLNNLVVQLYQESTDRNAKKQLLSMICTSSTKQELQTLIPGISTYAIDQARNHAKVFGEGVPLPEKEKITRCRMDREKLEHALDFFFDPAFHQVSSYGTKEMQLDIGEVLTIPQVVRTACHSTLVNVYQSFCEETDFQPLSRASLYKILSMCPASKQTNLKGLDNIAADGGIGFQTLLSLLENLTPYIQEKSIQVKELKETLIAFRCYLKTDYRAHIQKRDKCPTHCIQYALSDPTDTKHRASCDDHTHDFRCDRCDLFPKAIEDIKSLIKDLEGDLSADALTDFICDLRNAEQKIFDWQCHILRTVNQDFGRTDLLDSMSTKDCLIVMDWAMKFLPMAFREKQSDWYGQKGINWHVAVCIYKTEDNQIKHRTFAHCLEGIKQDSVAVGMLLEHTLKTVKEQLPDIEYAYLRSDNAGCYHCGALWFSIPSISKDTGIEVKRYDFSESQSGKSYCDAKIAHMRAKIRKSVADGVNVVCAEEMKTAIDKCGGVAGCQAAHLEICNSNSKVPGLIKGISKITNVEFTEDGQLIVWKAYGIGGGRKVTNPSAHVSEKEKEREIKVHAEFTPPKNLEGSLKFTAPTSHSDGVLSCPAGCTQAFSTFSEMYDHCLTGRHTYHLQKLSTFDSVKLRWYDSCMNLTESVAKVKRTSGVETETDQGIVAKGWALKKDRKNVRFSEKVKCYLRQVFEEGDRTGIKTNPNSVAKTMRVLREDGRKKFNSDEYLESSQIQSFFSRLNAEKKRPGSSDEEDIDSTVALLQKMEALEEITASLS